MFQCAKMPKYKWQDQDMLNNKAHIDANIINGYGEESTNCINKEFIYWTILYSPVGVSLSFTKSWFGNKQEIVRSYLILRALHLLLALITKCSHKI